MRRAADLDGLTIDDPANHDEGDRVIRETGSRRRTASVAEAAVARLGGDEFAGLAAGSSADHVLHHLARLRQPTTPESAFSAGVAVMAPSEELGDAMRRADLALYAVKKPGRGRYLLASAPVDLAVHAVPDDRLRRPSGAPEDGIRSLT